MTRADIAARAEALAGTPFRLHGRDARQGLDCVGVVGAALDCAERMPGHYRMRGGSLARIDGLAARLGLVDAEGPVLPGDVLLFRPSPCQLHFAVALGNARIVHAHAGLRRVVVGPICAHWPRAGHWRVPAPAPN